jgi:hypothetical protein
MLQTAVLLTMGGFASRIRGQTVENNRVKQADHTRQSGM